MSKKKVKDKMDKGNVGGKDDAVKSNASGKIIILFLKKR